LISYEERMMMTCPRTKMKGLLPKRRYVYWIFSLLHYLPFSTRKPDQLQRRLSKMKTLRGLHGYTLAKIEAVLTQSAIRHLLMASTYISPISI
jgi:hypothetical protein